MFRLALLTAQGGRLLLFEEDSLISDRLVAFSTGQKMTVCAAADGEPTPRPLSKGLVTIDTVARKALLPDHSRIPLTGGTEGTGLDLYLVRQIISLQVGGITALHAPVGLLPVHSDEAQHEKNGRDRTWRTRNQGEERRRFVSGAEVTCDRDG